MLSRLTPILLAIAIAVALLPAQPVPAEAADSPDRITPVFPGVARQEWRLTTPGSEPRPVAAQVLQVDAHPSLRVATVLAHDSVSGLETVPAMGQRLLPEGGVAGVNAGFWLLSPVGEPEGFYVSGGRLVSEAETQGDLPRGVFGIRGDGRGLVDRLRTKITFRDEIEKTLLEVTGLNRIDRNRNAAGGPHPFPDGKDAVYIYTPHFGDHVNLPGEEAGDRYRGPAAVMTFEDLHVPVSGATPFFVPPAHERVDGGRVDIPADGFVLVGYGDGAIRMREMPEAAVRLVVEVGAHGRDTARAAEWADVTEAVTGGPMIVSEGRMTDPGTWSLEGFGPGHLGRGPRTAAGATADGGIVLVTVDGRQTGHSEGMTMAELAEFMLRLGAVDAVALDGGGSSQMVVDGSLRNRPCGARDNCGPVRSVANGLFVFHDYPFERTERHAGPGREATAAAVAVAAFPDGADDVVLAAAGDFPDALAGGPLAARLGAPLLLAQRERLAPVTLDAITELGARRVTVLGGESVVGAGVVDDLRNRGLEVIRVSGATRFETAARIAATISERHERVFVAGASTFADALSAAAPAGILGAPILLATRDTLPGAVRDSVARAQPREVIIVGGGSVIGQEVERQLVAAAPPGTVFSRLAGPTRWGTAASVNRWAGQQIPGIDASALVVARGDTFPDALAGGPLAASRRQLLMIVPGGDVRAHPDAAAYLDELADGPLAGVSLLGGYGVLSSHQQWQLDQLAGG